MGVQIGSSYSNRGLVISLDPQNKNSWSNNCHPYPTDIYHWLRNNRPTSNTLSNNSLLTRDTSIVSPLGNHPVKMTVTGNDPYMYSYNGPTWNISPAVQNEVWAISVYAKSSVPSSGQIFHFGCNSSGNYFEAPALTISITENWQRFSYVRQMTNASTAFVQTRLDGADSGTVADIWWDGYQVERLETASSIPTDFNPIGNNKKIYYDLSPNKINAVSTNNTSTLYAVSESNSLKFNYLSLDGFTFADNDRYKMLGNQPYTLMCWIKPTRNPGSSNWTGIINRENNPGGGRDGFNLWLNGSTGSTVNLATERFTSGTQASASWSTDQSNLVNLWSLITVTYDGVSSLQLRVNKTLQASTTSATGQITNTSKVLEIGHRNNNNYFDGYIGPVRIYDRALSATEISEVYDEEKSRYGL